MTIVSLSLSLDRETKDFDSRFRETDRTSLLRFNPFRLRELRKAAIELAGRALRAPSNQLLNPRDGDCGN